MSLCTERQRKCLIISGYSRENTFENTIIPYDLLDIFLLYYDEWIYWNIRDKKYTQFKQSKYLQSIKGPKMRLSFANIQFQITPHQYRPIDKTFNWTEIAFKVSNIQPFPVYLVGIYMEIAMNGNITNYETEIYNFNNLKAYTEKTSNLEICY